MSPLQRDVAKAKDKRPQPLPPDWTCTSNSRVFDYYMHYHLCYNAKSETPLAMSPSMGASRRAILDHMFTQTATPICRSRRNSYFLVLCQTAAKENFTIRTVDQKSTVHIRGQVYCMILIEITPNIHSLQ